VEAIEKQILLPVPPDEAWDLVADLGGWFGADVDGAVELGEIVRIGGRRAVIERVDEPSRLRFRWLGEDPSRVDITLDPKPDGTTVHVIERRIEPAVTPEPQIGFEALART
jgi:uncharacterized protein YndB with AHSA1/START domain